MLFLVTGAGGVSKSTIRKLLEPEFTDVLEAVELAILGSTPQWSIAWRHEMVERMVRRALEVQRAGKHFPFCGDPVPPGEVGAAPSADRLDGLAVCLLDAFEAAQIARLQKRGDDLKFLSHHVAFADWMRHHVVDPRYRPDVIMQNGWPDMRWDQSVGTNATRPPWRGHVVDTSEREPTEVAREVAKWLRQPIHAHPH